MPLRRSMRPVVHEPQRGSSWSPRLIWVWVRGLTSERRDKARLVSRSNGTKSSARGRARPIEHGGTVMTNWRRRIRGAIGMGLVWAAAGIAAAAVVARLPGFESDLPFAFI